VVSSQHDLARAVDRLRSGGIVAFPTETVYGLGADALRDDAVARVFALKGRPAHNPLIVHVTGRDMVERVAAEWPDAAERLARAFWPGPLSIVVPRRAEVPDAVVAGGPTVAVRCPDHPLALALLFQFGGPLVGPSANRSGRTSPTTADHVRRSFGEADLVILDGGPCATGLESTVLAIPPDAPARILRPGVIGARDLAAVLGRAVVQPPPGAGAAAAGPLASPGLLASHYAPVARTILFDEDRWPDLVRRATGGGGPVAVITHRRRALPPPNRVIVLPEDAREYAALLYAALRQADDAGPALIAIERPPAAADAASDDAPIWTAVADRLARAAAMFGSTA
jgi:L-threonylcarbamoyladenylate synthase